MIVLFTDFGIEGPYIGQVKAVLYGQAPGVPVIDLFSDLAPHDARAAAYLLPSFAEAFAPGCVFLCVVDPGVGGSRAALVVEADGRRYVGPDNGLFEPMMRRARDIRCWEIGPPGEPVSATFHGRDVFAPMAAALARGEEPTGAGGRTCMPPRRPDWPDDLAEVVYVDRFGNLMTGLRAGAVERSRGLRVGGAVASFARTYSEVPPGQVFWYENANGLAEIAVNQGRAADRLGAWVGARIGIE